jgi:hypothetical protein
MRYVPGRDVTYGAFAILRLIVEENVCTERAQKLRFVGAAEEQAFVESHVPCSQRADDSLMRGRRARCHQRGSNGTRALVEFALQPMKPSEKTLERPTTQRSIGSRAFSRRERIETVAPKDPIRLVREQHRIPVERDSQFRRRIPGGA